MAATLTRTQTGLSVLHTRAADAVVGVTTAFNAADWAGQNVGTGTATVVTDGLSVSKSGVSGGHWWRYNPITFDGNGVVISVIGGTATGGNYGLATRFSTETNPLELVYGDTPFGFSSNQRLTDIHLGAASGQSTAASVNRNFTSPWRFLLAIEENNAAVRMQTPTGTSGSPDQILTLTGIDATGIYSGVQIGSGTTATVSLLVRQWGLLRRRFLQVNGPTTGNWRIRLKDATNTVILTSDVQSGGIATLDLLDNRDTWLGSSSTSLISLATQIEIYDDDTASIVAGPETPTERVWGGDVWTYSAPTPEIPAGGPFVSYTFVMPSGSMNTDWLNARGAEGYQLQKVVPISPITAGGAGQLMCYFLSGSKF